MNDVMTAPKETVTKTFYAVIGAPMIAGRKVKEFGTELFIATSIDDLEAAGREVTGSIKESKVVEQIQDGVEQIQESKVVEQIQEKVDVDQFQEKVDVLREQLETALHNWREQFTPGVASPKTVKEPVKKTAPKATTTKPAAKKSAPKATTRKAAPKKAAPKATATKTAPKATTKKATTKTAPKATAKKAAPKKTAPKTAATKTTPKS